MSAFFAPWRGRLLALGLAALLVAVTAANYQFALQAPGGGSFLSGWIAVRAWIVEGRSPYNPSVGLAAQTLLYGRPANPSGGEDPLAFSLPLPAVLPYLPFALAPYPLARALWMTLLEVCLPALALLGMRLARWRPSPGMLLAVLVFSLVWYHGLVAVVSGDLAPLEGLLIGGWLWAYTRRRDALAGVLLAASLIRPEIAFLTLPLGVASAVRARRWAMPAALAATLAAAIAASLLLQPGWPLPWIWRLLETQQAVGFESAIALAVGGAGRTAGIVRLVIGAGLLGYAVWEWARARRLDERGLVWAAQISLVVSLWVAPQRSTAALVVLLPSLSLLWGAWAERRSRRSGWVIVGSLLLVAGGSWALYLATAAQTAESPLLMFLVPTLTLLGLWWIRWWAIRPPLPTLEAG